MKLTKLFLGLFALVLSAQFTVIPPLGGSGSGTGASFVGVVGSLPGTCSDGDYAIVTDAATKDDCTVGSGSDKNVCICDASNTWLDEDVGGSTGDTITINGATTSDVDLDDADPAAPANSTNVKWQLNVATTPDSVSSYINWALVNSIIWGDNSEATITRTFDPTGSTNIVYEYTDGQQLLTVGQLTHAPGVVIDATHVTFWARKGSVGTINVGQVVYVSGFNAGTGFIEVELADADVSAEMPAVGIVENTITNTAEGEVVEVGELFSVDTSAFSVGDELYVSTTAGGLVSSPPTGEASAIQKIATVLRSNGPNGILEVVGAGRSNATPNLDSAAIFLGNSSNQSVPVDVTGDITISNTGVVAVTGAATNAIDLTTAVTGTLPVGNGGTGVTAPTDGGILLGSGSGPLTSLGVATNGQIPIGDGATDPVLANITAEVGGEVTISNGAGSIELDIGADTIDGNEIDETANYIWTGKHDFDTAEVLSASPFRFEGLTDDNNYNTFVFTDPSAGRTTTFPNANSNTVQPLTCSTTDKVSAISSLGVITCSADENSGGAPAWEALVNTADTATLFASDNVLELMDYNFTAAYGATDIASQWTQLTGNVTAGFILVDFRAADADATVLRAGDGTNGITVSQAGALTTEGTGTITATDLAADALDAMTEIATGIKLRADDTDTHLLTTSASIPGGNLCLEFDTNGSVVVAADTCANLGPGGSPAWNAILDPVAVQTITFGAVAEVTTFSFDAAHTLDMFTIQQQTGNPTTGALLRVTAADTTIDMARIDRAVDGANVLLRLGNTETHAAASTNETVDIEAYFDADLVARIRIGKEDDYDPGTGEDDSFMSFWTDRDGTLTEAFRALSTGGIQFNGSSETLTDSGSQLKYTGNTLGIQGSTAALSFQNRLILRKASNVVSISQDSDFTVTDILSGGNIFFTVGASGTQTVLIKNTETTIGDTLFRLDEGDATAGNLFEARSDAGTLGIIFPGYNSMDLSAANLTLPISAGAAPTANGTIAYDSTSSTLEYGDNTVNRVVVNLDEAQTLASKTLTTPTISGTGFTNAQHAHLGATSGGQLTAPALPNSIRDRTKSFDLPDPVTGDDGDYQVEFPAACTLQEVACNVQGGTSATVDLYERARATPDTGTTGMLTTPLVCTTTGAATTSFTDAALAAKVPLALGITAVSGTPALVRVHVTCRID